MENELPTHLSKEDALAIELASVYVNNAKLQMAVCEQQLAKANEGLEQAQKALAGKYSLTEKDQLDLRTLEIKRAQ